MSIRNLLSRVFPLCIAVILSIAAHAHAEDWPQWMGTQRDNVWNETGLIDSIPPEGLPVLWRTPIGGGYAGPAVVDGKVYVTNYRRADGELANDPNGRSSAQGTERVLCLDARTGDTIWQHEYECAYDISYAAGPRCTPTVDGDRVYTLGSMGHLFCLDKNTGEIHWSKLFSRDFGAEVPMWGYASHPLVYGDLLICVVGGPGSVAVAFDKNSGEEKWRGLTATEPAYCPPTIVSLEGKDQLLIWDAERLHGLNPLTGSELWQLPLVPEYAMAVAAPRQSGDLLYATAMGNIGGVFRLDANGRQPETVWMGDSETATYCVMSTPLIVEGTVYGVDNRTGALRAVSLASGERLWETYQPTTGANRAGHGNAFLVKNQDHFYLFSETGDFIVANLSPSGYEELGRFHVLEPTGEALGRNVVWSHPAFAEGFCFVRNDVEIVCVQLRKSE